MAVFEWIARLKPIELFFIILNLSVTLGGLYGIRLVSDTCRRLLVDLERLRTGGYDPDGKMHPTIASAIREYDGALLRSSTGQVNVGAIVNKLLARTPAHGSPIRLTTWSRVARTAISVCVILGLFGTFVGLTMALVGVGGALDKAAQQTGDAGDIVALLGQLRFLIGGMSTAFQASVWGVGGSLVLSVASALSGTFALPDRVADELEDYLNNYHKPAVAVVTSQDLQMQLIAKVEALTETLETGFSSGIGEAAHQFSATAASMANVLQQVEPVTRSLGTSGQSLAELSQTMGAVTRELQEAIAALRIGQEALPERMAQLHAVEERLIDTLGALPEQNRRLMEGLDLFLKGARSMDGALGEFKEQWPEWVDAFVNRTEQAVENHSLGVAQSIENLREILDQTRNETLTQMEQLVMANHTTADAITSRLVTGRQGRERDD